jgi:hypothetical protein
MYMCVTGINIASISTIFGLDFRNVPTVCYFRNVLTVCYFRNVLTVWYFRTVLTVWYYKNVLTVWYFRNVLTVWYFRNVLTVWYFRNVRTVWYFLSFIFPFHQQNFHEIIVSNSENYFKNWIIKVAYLPFCSPSYM